MFETKTFLSMVLFSQKKRYESREYDGVSQKNNFIYLKYGMYSQNYTK